MDRASREIRICSGDGGGAGSSRTDPSGVLQAALGNLPEAAAIEVRTEENTEEKLAEDCQVLITRSGEPSLKHG